MRLRNHSRRRAVARATVTETHTLDAKRKGTKRPRRRAVEAARTALPLSRTAADRTHVDGTAPANKRQRHDRRTHRALDRAHAQQEDSDRQVQQDAPVNPRDSTSELAPVAEADGDAVRLTDGAKAGVASSQYCLLQTAFAQEDRIDETSWLTSTLIDLMLWRLAAQYADVHFLATDFCHLHLPSLTKKRPSSPSSSSSSSPQESFDIRDVLGRRVESGAGADARPIVFVANVGRVHWNLLRVQFHPHAELQLFEPMGRLSSRSGISYRSVPRCVIEWLDACYPQDKSWITHSVSAITRPQQVSGFDCGVACLLYADKCGKGQPRESINASTDQHEITTFRSVLQRQLQGELLSQNAGAG